MDEQQTFRRKVNLEKLAKNVETDISNVVFDIFSDAVQTN